MGNSQEPRKRRSWSRLLLIGSLAVNLLVAGLVAGAVFRHEPQGSRHLDRMSFGLGTYVAALPGDRRADVERAIGGVSDKSRGAWRQDVRDARNAISEALRAEPFSETALREAIVTHREVALSRTVALQQALADAVAEMTPEERAAMLQRVDELKEKKRRDKKGWGK